MGGSSGFLPKLPKHSNIDEQSQLGTDVLNEKPPSIHFFAKTPPNEANKDDKSFESPCSPKTTTTNMKLMSKIKNEVEIKVNLFPSSPKIERSGKDESPGFNGA